MTRYYLCPQWALRSAELAELAEELGAESEEVTYNFALPEDHFYKMVEHEKENEEFGMSIFSSDKELAGGKLETKLIKDEEGNNLISWEFDSVRYYLDIDDLEELEEIMEMFPEITIGYGDEVSLGAPEPEEDYKMITLHLPEDLCPECGGRIEDCTEEDD